MSKGGDKEDAIFFVGNSWLKPWIANSSTSSLFLLLPLPHSLKRWKVVESPPPPVPTSFALRASTMTLIELGSITKNKHPVSFILKLDKPEIQHFVPVATRVFFLGKQTVPTLGPSCTGLTSLINAISFLRWDMEKPACMIILLTRYTTPSPWIRCAPIKWIRIRNKIE